MVIRDQNSQTQLNVLIILAKYVKSTGTLLQTRDELQVSKNYLE